MADTPGEDQSRESGADPPDDDARPSADDTREREYEYPDGAAESGVPDVSISDNEAPKSRGDLIWRLRGVVKTIRPHQWVKNVFVLAPVVFAKEIFDPLLLWRAGAAFLAFCLLAGAVYTMNDLADVEADRQHPVKRFRPIASGRVPIPIARGLVVALVVGALLGSAMRSWPFFAAAAAYFTLNVAYSLKLKHVAYLDVGCIAAGFVLRVVGGGQATQINVSHYLLVCTALLALFLGFGKRRHELSLAAAGGGKTRAALESYSPRGLDVALTVTALATVATYVAYTLDPHTQEFFKTRWLWPSALFVVLGVWRFLFLIRSRPRAESPTQEMLKDGPFVGIVLCWVVLVMWVVYHLRPS
ncbi:MAG: decaprenyl-phosphate phosphoribosyltransferase [Myxococcales bacterium]|nr:decaprenyl-phosphate phosphoribosyltransferase [Myxococcales bacterium]